MVIFLRKLVVLVMVVVLFEMSILRMVTMIWLVTILVFLCVNIVYTNPHLHG